MTLTTFITLNAVLAAALTYAIVVLLGSAITHDADAPSAWPAAEVTADERLAA